MALENAVSRDVRQGCWGSWAEITLQQGLFIGDISVYSGYLFIQDISVSLGYLCLRREENPTKCDPSSPAFAATVPVRSPGDAAGEKCQKLLQSECSPLLQLLRRSGLKCRFWNSFGSPGRTFPWTVCPPFTQKCEDTKSDGLHGAAFPALL